MASTRAAMRDISKGQRARALGQKPCVVWLTGLSAAGKSSIASGLQSTLFDRGLHCYLLDGDTVTDASFQGSGCAISKASASMMTDAVKGKRLDEVERMFALLNLSSVLGLGSPKERR